MGKKVNWNEITMIQKLHCPSRALSSRLIIFGNQW